MNFEDFIIDLHTWETYPVPPKGTRTKYMLINPAYPKRQYMLKMSKKNENYKFEFWSEVIASKYGQMLDFKVTDYNVGYREEGIGSLCYFEYKEESNLFREATQMLQTYCTEFQERSINAKISPNAGELLEHSFQDIKELLKQINRGNLIERFIEMFVFDSLIGNTDRHTENWALLIQGKLHQELHRMEKETKVKPTSSDENNRKFLGMLLLLIFALAIFYSLSNKKQENQQENEGATNNIKKLLRESGITQGKYRLCNLYDLSTCLGHELQESKIEHNLRNPDAIELFLKKGKQEIKWEDKKLNHFDFLAKVKTIHGKRFKKVAEKAISLYNFEAVETLVNNIDLNLPEKYLDYKLSDNRKLFIIKVLEARIEKLKELII